jgi:hypothetical protein
MAKELSTWAARKIGTPANVAKAQKASAEALATTSSRAGDHRDAHEKAASAHAKAAGGYAKMATTSSEHADAFGAHKASANAYDLTARTERGASSGIMHKIAGEAHLEAAKAHPAAASGHLEKAQEHAAMAGGAWNDDKHPRDENGRFTSV